MEKERLEDYWLDDCGGDGWSDLSDHGLDTTCLKGQRLVGHATYSKSCKVMGHCET